MGDKSQKATLFRSSRVWRWSGRRLPLAAAPSIIIIICLGATFIHFFLLLPDFAIYSPEKTVIIPD